MVGKCQRRKDIQDDNNYINKFGKITHVCPECGNLYVSNIKLNVECLINGNKEERKGYEVITPNIEKTCSCGAKTIQVDNRMGVIIKTLIDKGYKIESCCEGHAYVRNGVPTYDFPFIKIYGNVKALIPIGYYSKLFIYFDIDTTNIYSKNITSNGYCPCEFLGTFDEYKDNMLSLLLNLVKSLPDFPLTSDDNYDNMGCGNSGCCCCR